MILSEKMQLFGIMLWRQSEAPNAPYSSAARPHHTLPAGNRGGKAGFKAGFTGSAPQALHPRSPLRHFWFDFESRSEKAKIIDLISAQARFTRLTRRALPVRGAP